jgi:hypothetical protein
LGWGVGWGVAEEGFQHFFVYKMKAFVDSKGLSFVICRLEGKATPKIGKFLGFLIKVFLV